MENLNKWHRYEEKNMPKSGLFLAFVAEGKPQLYVAHKDISKPPTFWNGQDWITIPGIITAWHPIPDSPNL
ncbi:MAG: hypothetical protein ACRYG7_25300 [Janthinobacterium lividum]